jgi:hypothetical protein
MKRKEKEKAANKNIDAINEKNIRDRSRHECSEPSEWSMKKLRKAYEE